MAETSYIIQNGRRLNLKDSSARKSIGSCDELQTETKHCLVHAINELNQKVGSGGGAGSPGADGQDGKDGVSCTHEWNGTVLTVTSASGTSSADLKGDTGAAGYTPVKGVDYFDGQNGKDGANGVSATHTWNGTTLTITSASGTSSADLKGESGKDGVDGSPGKDGYTPVKGVDYFDGEPGADGKDGKDGYTPVKGVDYTDGKDGADGKDATINGVNALTLNTGAGLTKSQNGSTLTLGLDAHNHDASNITSGILSAERGGTGYGSLAELAAALGGGGGGAKIATGSYTGAGSYGSSNKNSLTFEFEPKVVFVFPATQGLLPCDTNSSRSAWVNSFVWCKDQTISTIVTASVGVSVPAKYNLNFTLSGNTLSWYTSGTTAAYQLNGSAVTYNYVAIG